MNTKLTHAPNGPHHGADDDTNMCLGSHSFRRQLAGAALSFGELEDALRDAEHREVVRPTSELDRILAKGPISVPELTKVLSESEEV
jgi:hypothetical protein